MTDTNAVIAVYDNHKAAEDAAREPQKFGSPSRLGPIPASLI
jgi:hypothetical protein